MPVGKLFAPKDRKTERQKDRKTERQKDRMLVGKLLAPTDIFSKFKTCVFNWKLFQ